MLGFSLAGVGFQLRSGAGVVDLQLSPAYAPFLGPSPIHPIAGYYGIRPPVSGILEAVRADRLIWECLTWRMGISAGGLHSIEISAVPDNRWITVANINQDFSGGTICPFAGRLGAPSPYALNYPWDQAILMNRLLYFGAGIVHSCGVVIDGQGFMFAGRSGAGKTTISRLWRKSGAILLNDDRVIVRIRDGQLIVCATPWHGEDSEMRPDIVPLRAIFHLEQSSVNRLHRLPETRALTSLLATTVAPFYSAAGMDQLLAVWATVAERVPSYILEFTPDQRPLDLCRAEVIDRIETPV